MEKSAQHPGCRWQSRVLNWLPGFSPHTVLSLAGTWGWGPRHQHLGLPSAVLSVFWPQAIVAGKVGNSQEKSASEALLPADTLQRTDASFVPPTILGPLGTFPSRDTGAAKHPSIHPFIHSLAHSLIHSPSHSFIPSLRPIQTQCGQQNVQVSNTGPASVLRELPGGQPKTQGELGEEVVQV